MWPESDPNWINDLSFESGDDDDDDESGEDDDDDESGDDDDDDKSDFTDTELVNDPVFYGPTNPLTIAPTTSRNHAFLYEWEGGWVGSCSPPHRPWMGESSQCLYK